MGLEKTVIMAVLSSRIPASSPGLWVFGEVNGTNYIICSNFEFTWETNNIINLIGRNTNIIVLS